MIGSIKTKNLIQKSISLILSKMRFFQENKNKSKAVVSFFSALLSSKMQLSCLIVTRGGYDPPTFKIKSRDSNHWATGDSHSHWFIGNINQGTFCGLNSTWSFVSIFYAAAANSLHYCHLGFGDEGAWEPDFLQFKRASKPLFYSFSLF